MPTDGGWLPIAPEIFGVSPLAALPRRLPDKKITRIIGSRPVRIHAVVGGAPNSDRRRPGRVKRRITLVHAISAICAKRDVRGLFTSGKCFRSGNHQFGGMTSGGRCLSETAE